MSAPTLKLDWTPHPGQREVLESDARFRVVACGRRWGKTACAGYALFKKAAQDPDSLCFWVAPTYDIAETGFTLLEEIVPEGLTSHVKRTKPKAIELVNGSEIEFRSADREDGLVSVGLDMVVIDEAAMVPKRAWTKELRPTLSDTLGDMIAISTPMGRNWFHDYFQRGQSEDYPDVESWRSPTYENPHVPDSEVDAAREEIPERVFEQEYLAKFLDDSGGVFQGVRENAVADYDVDAVTGEPPYSTGVDFARHEDYTVIETLDANSQLVNFERFQTGGQAAWPQIQTAIERVYEQYPGLVLVDATRDNKIVADLEAAGVDVEPVKFTAPKKRQLIEDLAAAIEQGQITIPDIPQLVSELQIFEYDVTRAGNVRYHAPEGHHDDCVDGLALALDGVGRGSVATTTVSIDDGGRDGGPTDGLPGLGGR